YGPSRVAHYGARERTVRGSSASRDDGAHGRGRVAARRDPRADPSRDRRDRPSGAGSGWPPRHHRGQRDASWSRYVRARRPHGVTLAFALAALAELAAALWPAETPRIRALLARPRKEREARAALPALVEALASALGSGLSLPLAFAEIAPTLGVDLASATRRVGADLALGAHVGDALSAYAGVVPAQDIAPLAIVLSAFDRSGGRV